MPSSTRRHSLLSWARFLPLLLVPLLLLAGTFPGEYRVPGWYWVTAFAAAATFLVGGRRPLPVSLVLSALAAVMFTEHAWGLAGLVPYLGAIGVGEVAMRSRRAAPVIVATAGWTGSVLLGLASETYATFWRPATAVETLAVVGLPLLLGLYLRAQRDLAATYAARAAEAESRRAGEAARARADERSALARELHDLVAHHMASIVLRIGVARHVVAEADPRVRSVFDDVHATASGALSDIRRLLVALRDPALGEVALVEAGAVPDEIAAAVDRTRAAGFTVDVRVDPDLGRLDAIGRLTLLRVVQESLTNTMKHADPDGAVTVAVTRRDGGVAVRVTNRRPAGAEPNIEGHGLIGMAERVTLAGGRLDVTADGDWRVDAWLPAETDTEEQG
ncbi:sensor histidine kinase [Prescottella subtropica]|uniref:sensor histidine kinase n=1 Tax=Prescottella subtropica TaxID=2545757 RepID=UPI0010F561C5|nr:histidine kinase [Prescottella subtropica]